MLPAQKMWWEQHTLEAGHRLQLGQHNSQGQHKELRRLEERHSLLGLHM